MIETPYRNPSAQMRLLFLMFVLLAVSVPRVAIAEQVDPNAFDGITTGDRASYDQIIEGTPDSVVSWIGSEDLATKTELDQPSTVGNLSYLDELVGNEQVTIAASIEDIADDSNVADSKGYFTIDYSSDAHAFIETSDERSRGFSIETVAVSEPTTLSFGFLSLLVCGVSRRSRG
ncbi:hypothetical protein [Mariniblastus fucicola]|uniref:hypothetical protein n=1 Tax=Mariniblastus fucicola TaxID=980251 RepID=UPI001EE40740|nr:hypothetical protein [Mariniblastus fucicola]